MLLSGLVWVLSWDPDANACFVFCCEHMVQF